MHKLKEIRATFDCARCGKEFSTTIEPADKINTDYCSTPYDLAINAVRGALNYEGPENIGLCGITDGDVICGKCNDLDLEQIHPERPQDQWKDADFYKSGQVPIVGDVIECVRGRDECDLIKGSQFVVKQVCSGFIYFDCDAWRSNRFKLIKRATVELQ